MGKGADAVDVLKLFLFLQPSILMLSIPMSILIAIFLTYGRMATDSEIVVLKASGMSFWGISRASVIVSLFCFVVILFNSMYLLPRGMYSFKRTLHETIVKKAAMTFEESSFTDVFKGTVIFVKEKITEDEFKGVFVFRDADESLDRPFVIAAKYGVISSNPEEGIMKLSMKEGLIHTFKDSSSSEILFSKYDLILTSGIEAITASKPEEIKTMTLWNARKENIRWESEFHRRLALPFACLIFGILGPALSCRIGKIGRVGGFSLSLLILIVYYMMLLLGKGLADAEKITPFWGGWAPNMIFGVITVIFFYFAQKDRPIGKLKF